MVSRATAENEKYALEFLQRVKTILTAESALKLSRLHGIGFDEIMPRELLRASLLRKLANFEKKGLWSNCPPKLRSRR